MADMARSLGAASVAAPLSVPSSSRLQERKILNSWKEIATYLDRGVRTVQRWHADLGLPVHKVRDTRHSPVFAYRVELDEWLRACAKQTHTESLNRPVHECRSSTQLLADKTKELASRMLSLVSQQRYSLCAILATVNRVQALRQKRQGSTGLKSDRCLSSPQVG